MLLQGEMQNIAGGVKYSKGGEKYGRGCKI